MVNKLDFITPTFMTVFEFFLADPMKEYHEREVMRRTGVSKGSANKILRLLGKSQFLVRERKGRMAFYRLNTADPVVRQFKLLLNVYSLKKFLQELKEHCRRIILFGSCSQGTDVEESDIDLFFLTSDKDLIRRKINDFNEKNSRRIAPIVVNATEFAKLRRGDRALYENIKRGIVLWEKE